MRTLFKLATLVVAPVVTAVGMVATAPAASAAYTSTVASFLRELENQAAIQVRAYDPSTLPLPACDAPGVSLCIDNPSPTGTMVPIPSVDLNPTAISHVTAYVHFYEVGVGTTGTGLFPCVVLSAPGSANGCQQLGLKESTDFQPIALADEDVSRYDPSVGPTLVTVGVCSATARVKLNGGDAFHTDVKTICTS